MKTKSLKQTILPRKCHILVLLLTSTAKLINADDSPEENSIYVEDEAVGGPNPSEDSHLLPYQSLETERPTVYK